VEKCVLIYSGGLDSTTLLYYLKDKYDIQALSFNYGQRHKKELECATKITRKINVYHKIVDISTIKDLISVGAITGGGIVPHGNYSRESQKQTIVPNRNAIMLTIATGYAVTIGVRKVFYAAHYSDRAVYPDCRKEFVEAINTAMRIGNDDQVEILAPFVQMTKAEIVLLGDTLCVPFEETWSCYEGREIHCGICGTCFERKEAFYIAGVRDPTKYEV